MEQPFFENSSREFLRAENDFMKMKLMLEKGAVFGSAEPGMMTPEVENEFLQRIIEMEAQFERSDMVTIFEKIGSPSHFVPVEELSDKAIDQAWDQLYDCLCSHAIQLAVSSPYVSNRELYRFVTEEFFQVEIEASDPPGVVSLFHYDHFHPDPFYENTQTALEYCIKDIFFPKAADHYYYMMNKGIRLNANSGLTLEDYVRKLKRSSGLFDQLELLFLEDTGCRVYESECIVTGKYSVKAYSGKEEFLYSGNWTIIFEPDGDRYFWYARQVMLEGFPI